MEEKLNLRDFLSLNCRFNLYTRSSNQLWCHRSDTKHATDHIPVIKVQSTPSRLEHLGQREVRPCFSAVTGSHRRRKGAVSFQNQAMTGSGGRKWRWWSVWIGGRAGGGKSPKRSYRPPHEAWEDKAKRGAFAAGSLSLRLRKYFAVGFAGRWRSSSQDTNDRTLGMNRIESLFHFTLFLGDGFD